MKTGNIVKIYVNKKGHEIVFRYPKPDDLDNYLTCVNELIEEDTFLLLSGKKLTKAAEKKYLTETIIQVENNEKIQLVVLVDGKFAGNGEIRRQPLRKKHVGVVGIAIGRQFRNEGIGTELLKTLIERGSMMGLKLLILSAFEINEKAIHLYEKIGFKKSGVVPGSYAYKNKYIGEVSMYLILG